MSNEFNRSRYLVALFNIERDFELKNMEKFDNNVEQIQRVNRLIGVMILYIKIILFYYLVS